MAEAKVALVTGATSGIGEACVAALVSQGWRIVATGRDQGQLDALEATHGEAVVGIAADLAADDLEALVADAAARFGRLDGLINAAGILLSGSTEDASIEGFDRSMEVNVRAPFRLSKAAIPHLKATRGAIVNVSSVTGIRPFPGVLAYCVSKSALDQMTRCMAIELAASGVRVNAVNPGVVVTQLHRRGGMDEAAYEAFLERSTTTHPLGRVGQPEEIARLIIFLLGDEAGWVTGETIAIDGGRHLTAAR